MSFSSAITLGLGRTAMVFALTALAAGLAHAEDAKPTEKPASADRYEIHGGTVYDKTTDLTWSRCNVGKTWSKKKKACVGTAKEFTFDDAQKLAKDGWRLPTKDELEKLIDEDRKTHSLKPYLDITAFPFADRNQVYWSSTPHDDPGMAWVALFGFGEIELYSRNMTYEAILVHNGK